MGLYTDDFSKLIIQLNMELKLARSTILLLLFAVLIQASVILAPKIRAGGTRNAGTGSTGGKSRDYFANEDDPLAILKSFYEN